jgi:BASS family bile acid:Na+ symporter
MFFSIIKMVILPLIAGFLIKLLLKDKLKKIIKVFPALSTIFIAFICGLVVALNKEHLKKINLLIFVATLLHNLTGLTLGYVAGKLYGFSQKMCRTLSIEVGMQNAGLGAVLALKHFSPGTAIPNAFFAILCIVTASLLARIWSRKKPTPHETSNHSTVTTSS